MSLPSGRLVATARTLLDLSQRDLAALAGVHERTIGSYEASPDAAPPGAKIGTYGRVVEALEAKGIRFAPNGVALVQAGEFIKFSEGTAA
jgi:transcriptional regulator with XRE-family HTH domain